MKSSQENNSSHKSQTVTVNETVAN